MLQVLEPTPQTPTISASRLAAGSVALVGAGAGEAAFLTLGALRALEQADIVFTDALVDATILALIPNDVDVRRVGKRAGGPSVDQDHIIQELIMAARRGLRVVRLKGGDPFIFGRGGEEASALRDAGLDVEVVPGLTAAIVAAAATNIPLTDRRASTQVTFITAATAQDTTTDLRGLVGPGKTLVIYMGVGKAADIARQLLADPATAQTPVAIIESAGRTSQNIIFTTPKHLRRDAARRDKTKPALIIIGDVVSLAVRHG
jgi:uroporphyrin-III C-methyltransferase